MKLLNKDEFIANEIKYYLISKKLAEGDKLPSERELSEIFDVQRATVRVAYRMLAEEGLIEIRERNGRYMGHPRIVSNLEEIKSFSAKLNDIGLQTNNKLISFEVIEVDKELSKKIKLSIGTTVYKLTRVRNILYTEYELPISIEYAYIPERVAPKLFKYDLEENSLFSILKSEYNIEPSKEEQIVEIVYANDFEAKTLRVNKLNALVKKSGIIYDEEDNVLQYLNSVMNKDWVEFEKGNTAIEDKVRENAYGL